MAHQEQVNTALRNALAEVINRELEFPNALITVSFVKCSEDLKYATVGVSILPSNYQGTALKVLRSQSGHLAQALKNRVNFRRLPKFRWVIDSTESRAQIVEEALAAEAAELEEIIKPTE